MIDLEKLKNFDLSDLSDLDFEEIKERLLERKDILATCALIIITIFICFKIFSSVSSKSALLEKSLKEVEEKVELVEKFQQLQQEESKVVEQFLSPLGEQEILTFITKESSDHNIKLQSISPAKREKIRDYEQISIQLTCVAESYEQMHKFINSLENSTNTIRIDSWTYDSKIVSDRRGRRSTQISNENFSTISFSVKLVSVHIN